MEKFNSVEDVIDFAIRSEIEACTLYRDLAERADNGSTRDILLGFAAEEVTHRLKLEAIKDESQHFDALKEMPHMTISHYLHDTEATPDMSFEEILLFAMQDEVHAFHLYTDLAKATASPQLQELFIQLAQEEVVHEERFKIVYEETYGPLPD